MANNEVNYGGQLVLSVRNTTAERSDVSYGKVFTQKNGVETSGTAEIEKPVVVTFVQTATVITANIDFEELKASYPFIKGLFGQDEYYVTKYVINENLTFTCVIGQVIKQLVYNYDNTATYSSFNITADLSNYYTKQETDSHIANHHDNSKVDKVEDKGLSTNDYTTEEKTKLSGIENGANKTTKTSDLSNDSGFITKNVSDLVNYDNSNVVNQKIANEDTSIKSWANGRFITEHQSLSEYRKSADQDVLDNVIRADITDIEALIPTQATSSNKLADKEFVNSSISTATATHRGTSATGLTEAQFLEWANSLPHDLNDYVFWNTVDSVGNTQFKRYKFDGTNWNYEYTLNNSSFTAAQWASIQSGITQELVSQITTNQNNITSLDTNKVDKVNGKGLSTNDFTTEEKTKLSGIENGAKANVQSDWNESDNTKDDFIKNKPSIYTQSEVDTLLSGKANENEVVKHTSQSLTDAQKLQARSNIGTQKIWSGTTEPTAEIISQMAIGDMYCIREE